MRSEFYVFVCILATSFYARNCYAQNNRELDAALDLLNQLGFNATTLPGQLLELLGIFEHIRNGTDSMKQSIKDEIDKNYNNMNKQCLHDINEIMSPTTTDTYMASLGMMDAMGKFRAGLLEGNIQLLGSYGECIAVDFESIKGRHCVVNMPPFDVGVCVPDTCKAADVKNLASAVSLFASSQGQLSLYVHSAKCDMPFSELESLSTLAIIVIVILTVLMILIIDGTVYDVTIHQPRLEQIASEQKIQIAASTEVLGSQVTVESFNYGQMSPRNYKPSLPAQLILCFSLYTNCLKLVSMKHAPNSLECLHGIRVMSLLWVFMGHTLGWMLPIAANPTTFVNTLLDNWTFQGINKATLSVDTFFVIGGLLLSYLFFKQLEKLHFNLRSVNWPMYFIHRYVRLTPTYLLVLVTYLAFTKYIGHGPLWEQGESFEDKNCAKNWFYNILYINNFVHPSGETCMGWTWYLANDMQFYVVSPIFLAALALFMPAGIAMCCIMVLISMITTGVLEKQYPYQFAMGALGESFEYVYVKPYCRMGAYFIGLMTGYLLYRCELKVKLWKAVVFAGWMISTVLVLAVIYGPFGRDRQMKIGNSKETVAPDTMAFYAATSRIIWSCAVSWVIFACLTGYGGIVNSFLSWKIFLPFSRMTYCGYLVHPVVMTYVTNSQKDSLKADALLYVMWFLAFTVLSYMTAFVTTLLFESPIIALEKVLLRKRVS